MISTIQHSQLQQLLLQQQLQRQVQQQRLGNNQQQPNTIQIFASPPNTNHPGIHA